MSVVLKKESKSHVHIDSIFCFVPRKQPFKKQFKCRTGITLQHGYAVVVVVDCLVVTDLMIIDPCCSFLCETRHCEKHWLKTRMPDRHIQHMYNIYTPTLQKIHTTESTHVQSENKSNNRGVNKMRGVDPYYKYFYLIRVYIYYLLDYKIILSGLTLTAN